MKKTYDFSKGIRGAVVASDRRKVRITIRLDKDVIDWYRKKVEASGEGNYQTLINNSLKESIQRKKEPTEMMFRRIIKEELSSDNYKYPWRQLKIPTGFLLDSAL